MCSLVSVDQMKDSAQYLSFIFLSHERAIWYFRVFFLIGNFRVYLSDHRVAFLSRSTYVVLSVRVFFTVPRGITIMDGSFEAKELSDGSYAWVKYCICIVVLRISYCVYVYVQSLRLITNVKIYRFTDVPSSTVRVTCVVLVQYVLIL